MVFKKIVFSFLSLFCFVWQSNAQEGIPVYFDYLADNYYLVYPSMAGISEGGKIRATARQQWFSVDDAPNLQTLNANFRIGQSNSGVGVILYNDANGYHSQGGIKLTYAHHLKLGGDARSLNQISFGLSPTFLQSSLDETEFTSITVDPAVIGSKISQGYFNTDLGISYSRGEFYTHFAVLNMLGTERKLYRYQRADAVNVIDNLRRYLISVGQVFGKSEWQVEPSILFQMTDFTKEKSIDLNAKVYKDVTFGRLWGGLSYRRSFGAAEFADGTNLGEQRLQLLTPIVGANIKNFMVSYNYSYQQGDIRLDNGGFHQITLGYDFGRDNKRYDCYCPAAN